MDWRNRKYYCVSFSLEAVNMRLEIIKIIPTVKIRMGREVPKQPDELEERGRYDYLISVLSDEASCLEYELRKAEVRDGYCKWKEIKRNDPHSKQPDRSTQHEQ